MIRSESNNNLKQKYKNAKKRTNKIETRRNRKMNNICFSISLQLDWIGMEVVLKCSRKRNRGLINFLLHISSSFKVENSDYFNLSEMHINYISFPSC